LDINKFDYAALN